MTENDSHHIRQWLESSEGLHVLRQIALSIRKRSDFKILQAGFSGTARILGNERAEEAKVAELISELCIFILEKSPRIAALMTKDATRLSGFLYIGFLNHLKEKARRSSINAERSLYRRISRVFSQSCCITIKRMKNGSSFSLSQHTESICIPRLLEEDLREIPFPLDETGGLTMEAISGKAYLLKLGICFWENVSAMWGGRPVWVGMFDFVQWLRLHVVMDRPAAAENKDVSFIANTTGCDEVFFDAAQILSWAKMFAERLNEKEKAVLIMALEHGMTLSEMTTRLGLKSSSASRYHREHAYEKLRDFLRDRPWLSPGDLNPEALGLFHGELMKIIAQHLQKSDLMPSLPNRR